MNVVVQIYYSFQLHLLAVVWQSVELKICEFSEILQSYFWRFLAHPVGKQLTTCAGLCQFAAG